MVLWCYVATMSTDPGTVPPGWHPFADALDVDEENRSTDALDSSLLLHEPGQALHTAEFDPGGQSAAIPAVVHQSSAVAMPAVPDATLPDQYSNQQRQRHVAHARWHEATESPPERHHALTRSLHGAQHSQWHGRARRGQCSDDEHDDVDVEAGAGGRRTNATYAVAGHGGDGGADGSHSDGIGAAAARALQYMQRPRWCRKCKAWKPPRSHHCSASRKCVLKMDHYCVRHPLYYLFCSFGGMP
jgi:hypothetical protein